MSQVNVTLPADGTTADVADYNTPILAMLAAINGGLDSTNFAAGSINVDRLANQDGWYPSNESWTYNGNNGNKEFTVLVSGDKTSKYSPGMRVKIPRAVTPPTQCMGFTAASTQYATKASPAGITFTGPFTAEAWVYLNSYTGLTQFIINREDIGSGTGGWALQIKATGQVKIEYGGGASNYTGFTSSQAIPLRRWVHIAGVITSVAGKTGQIYINGTAVNTVADGAAATTLVQIAADLRVGAAATPVGGYLDGYISEARVWNIAQSQANIQANMGISLVGSETNLVALFQGNGNFNDKTSNANNLTASGSASSTQSANPYNTNEYANIVAVSYGAPNTTLTLNTGNYGTIPNQSPLGSPSYSMNYNPLGFPPLLERPALATVLIGSSFATGATTATQIPGGTATVTIPTGNRDIEIEVFSPSCYNGGSAVTLVSVWDGVVGSGTLIGQGVVATAAVEQVPLNIRVPANPVAGSKTYNLGLHVSGGTGNFTTSVSGLASLVIKSL